MALFFYKRIIVQTKYTSKDVQEIFTDIINGSRKNEEIEKLVLDHKYVRLHLKENRFQIMSGENTKWLGQEPGIRTILKGTIIEDKAGTTISIAIRPTDRYLLILACMFLFIVAVLSYSIATHNSTPTVISSILLFSFYTMLLIFFNSLVKRYRRVITGCFADPKYNFSHLS